MAAVRILRKRPSSSSSLFFQFLIFFLLLPPLILSDSNTDALLKLKASFSDPKNSLETWKDDGKPICDGTKTSWAGVVCIDGFVTGLHLGQMGLSGKIDVEALRELPGFRTLLLEKNEFSGAIPDFSRLVALRGLFLAGNKFSGEVPDGYFGKYLRLLWLSGNAFTGKIPTSLGTLPHLTELHLENNQFSGAIPPFTQSTLKSIDLSNNKLEGEIPAGLSKFDKKFFAGNAGLCGKQLGTECKSPVEPESPSDDPMMMAPPQENPESKKLVAATIVLITMLLLLVIAAILVMKKRKEDFDVLGRENLDEPLDVQVAQGGSNRSRGMESSRKGMDSSRKGSSHNNNKNAGMGDLVMVNEERGILRLPDLMKAAAEVLGNGSLGSAYKAVMSSGVAVVVKRMREMNKLGKDGFDMEMRNLGRLRHRNILTPLAYHYRKEEKLLICEYVPKGSLLYLLHGDRGPCHAELDWPARLKIVQGIARGMGFLHTELASCSIPHGNLKSSNILLASDYEPLLADYGYIQLVNTPQAAQAMLAYKAPESLQYRHVSPKCDVYCLGIVILEILTGKFPSQYLNNGKGGTDVVQWVLSAIAEKREAELFDPEISGSKNAHSEMERLLHIGADCVEPNPEQRPDMKEAIRRIEEVQVERLADGAAIQQAPTLKDGYADQTSTSHALDVFEGNNVDLSR
ncbi:hypothetical protein MKW94_017844 [Papaver nudicaule]|uniref:Protein kinase domain-containing protein n=1 Tax=Papaver nudicaule TaxID=74823 RepID=A0AA41V982_PAPNU|nr:hypothetical protein [Papaver nudicaule]